MIDRINFQRFKDELKLKNSIKTTDIVSIQSKDTI